MNTNKKGLVESNLVKVVIGVVLLIILIGIIMVGKGRLGDLWRYFSRIFRFGG